MKIVLYKTYIILAGIILLNTQTNSQNKPGISAGTELPEADSILLPDSTTTIPDLTILSFYQQG